MITQQGIKRGLTRALLALTLVGIAVTALAQQPEDAGATPEAGEQTETEDTQSTTAPPVRDDTENSPFDYKSSEEISEDLLNHISNLQKPVLPYVSLQEFEDAYANFYNTEVLK